MQANLPDPDDVSIFLIAMQTGTWTVPHDREQEAFTGRGLRAHPKRVMMAVLKPG